MGCQNRNNLFMGWLVTAMAGVFLFTAGSVQAAKPVINSIVFYESNGTTVAPAGKTYNARDDVKMSAVMADMATAKNNIYYWDFGDDFESTLGDSNDTRVGFTSHKFDRGAPSPGKIFNGRLLAIDATTGEMSDPKIFTVTVLPRTATSGGQDKWPFAHITRPGNGPYGLQLINFGAGKMETGRTGTAVFQQASWSLKNGAGENLVTNTLTLTKGAQFSYTFTAPGYYQLTQVATERGADGIDFYDDANFVFEVKSNPTPAELAEQNFSVKITASPPSIDMNTPDPRTEYVHFTATVTGGTPGFTYSWLYPPETEAYDAYQSAPQSGSTNELSRKGVLAGQDARTYFMSPGLKPIRVTVLDNAWREVIDGISYKITNPAITSINPPEPPDAEVSVLPLGLSLVQRNSTPLQVTGLASTGLNTVTEQTYDWHANVTGGAWPYTYYWSRNGASVNCPTADCTFKLNTMGINTIKLDLTDGANKTVNQSVSITLVAVNAPPNQPLPVVNQGAGGTGTTGGTPGASTVTVPPGTIGNPLETNFGLNESTYGNVGLSRSDNFKTIATNVINWVLGFLGIVAVVLMLWGGFKMMTASGDEEKAAAGKKTLVYAVIGLIIIFLAWGIASFVLSQLKSVTA